MWYIHNLGQTLEMFFYLGHYDLLSDLWVKVHVSIATIWKLLYHHLFGIYF